MHRLPTNTTTRRHAIHRWFNFVAGFSPEFVSHCYHRQNLVAPHPLTLLDPFAGCGTALVSARQFGASAIGYEPHPIFSRICKAKVLLPSPQRRKDVFETIESGLHKDADISQLGDSQREYLSKLYGPQVLPQLLGARIALANSEQGIDDFAFLVLSKLIDQCSHSKTDGIYKAPTSKKTAAVPLVALSAIRRIIDDDLEPMPFNGDGKTVVHCSDRKSVV